MIKRMLALAALLALPLFPANTAEAATLRIDGGITKVRLSAGVSDLGLSAIAQGAVDQSGLAFFFPISGGETDGDGINTIEHDGVGLTLSSSSGASVTVGDFVIDLQMGSLLGTVNGGSDFIPLFDLVAAERQKVKLIVTDTLAGALTSIFGAPDLTGAKFGIGTARPDISEVPLPATALLLLAGVGGFGLMRRRQKAA